MLSIDMSNVLMPDKKTRLSYPTEAQLVSPWFIVPNQTKSGMIFSGKFLQTAKAVRENYPYCDFDHRPFFEDFIAHPDIYCEAAAFATDSYRLGYVGLKYSLAVHIRPKSILEIGLGSGVSALSFMKGVISAGEPVPRYTNIEIGSFDVEVGYPFREKLMGWFEKFDWPGEFILGDSQRLAKLPEPGRFDLVHINGAKGREEIAHDFLLAWDSGSEWILLDDARDTLIISGFGDGARSKVHGIVEWAFFEDSFVGNILVRHGKFPNEEL